MTNIEVPPKPERDVIREVDWLAVAPWLLVLRAFGATIGWPMVIGVIGVITLGWFQGGEYSEHFFNPDQLATLGSRGWGTAFATGYARIAEVSWLHHFVWPTLRQICWMLLGVMMAQHAARSLAGARPLGIFSSFWRTLRLIPRLLGAITILAIPIVIGVIGLWFCGLFASAVAWESLVSLLINVAGVLLGLPIVVCLSLIVFAAPLLAAAIVVDDSDAFDAVSRTTAYVFQKPGSLVACVLIGWVGLWVASYVATWLQGGTTFLIDSYGGGAKYLVNRVLMGFFPAYFYCAGVATYLVMRRQVDGQPLDEIAHAEGAA